MLPPPFVLQRREIVERGVPARGLSRLFDASTGWLNIRQPDAESKEHVEFADGVVAGLAEERVFELWLHPVFVESLRTK